MSRRNIMVSYRFWAFQISVIPDFVLSSCNVQAVTFVQRVYLCRLKTTCRRFHRPPLKCAFPLRIHSLRKSIQFETKENMNLSLGGIGGRVSRGIKPFVPDFPLTYAWRCPAQEPDSLCSLCHTIHTAHSLANC